MRVISIMSEWSWVRDRHDSAFRWFLDMCKIKLENLRMLGACKDDASMSQTFQLISQDLHMHGLLSEGYVFMKSMTDTSEDDPIESLLERILCCYTSRMIPQRIESEEVWISTSICFLRITTAWFILIRSLSPLSDCRFVDDTTELNSVQIRESTIKVIQQRVDIKWRMKYKYRWRWLKLRPKRLRTGNTKSCE